MYAVISTIVACVLMVMSNVCFANYGSSICHKSGFSCYRVKHRDSWNSLFGSSSKIDLVKRINRMNTPLYPGLRIAIPDNLNADPMDFAPLPKQMSAAAGKKYIYVSLNPSILAWGAYDEKGNLVNWGPVSGGQAWCPDEGRGCHTALGQFQVYSVEGEDCVSRKFPVGHGGAPMPYCMYFHNGFALHGSHEVPGFNASHGCVRMFVPDAEWLNHEFLDKQPGMTVIITNQA